MGWNQPDPKKDPWRSKSQPPDIDAWLKQLAKKLKKIISRSPLSIFRGKRSASFSGGFLPILAMAFLFFAVIWLVSGFFIVDPAERAVILRFGKYEKTVGPGPHWIPQMISSKIILNVDRVADYSYSAQMLTQDENLVSVALVVQYRIGDLQEYLFNVSDPEESLQQATSSALRQVVGTTTLDQLITEGREAWGSSVYDFLVKILDGYKAGIVIVNVSPQPARAPENVQDAFDDAIKAQEDEKRFKEQARAYEASVVPIAEGAAKRISAEAKAYAEQVVWNARGETAEFLSLLPQYMSSPFVTAKRMYLDTMQRVFAQSSKMIIDAKSNPIVYLPLDKMMDNTSSKSAPLNKLSKGFSGSSLSSNPLTENHSVSRISTREERNI